ncbi:Dabb family protein [Devosia sp. ZB163]|uniref:Dabb family protein n=1 Tax=Devosia sp. ZB163 TaxID=3025938 RepID=UPI00235EA188|nr:Dabb family protein [Devosia sp. ZB163]MDC9824471.1 Dabb family protein [Devosia sp. ZB163]
MIRHIVFFTAKDPADLERIVEGLELLGQIPHSQHFEVTRNTKVDQFGNDVDVVVYAEFADEAALAAYKAHPIYAEATRRVRPLRELRFAADVTALEADVAMVRRSA